MQKQNPFFGRGQWLDFLMGICIAVSIKALMLHLAEIQISERALRDFLLVNLAMALIAFLGRARTCRGVHQEAIPEECKKQSREEPQENTNDQEQGWTEQILFSAGLLILLVNILLLGQGQKAVLSLGASLITFNLFFYGILHRVGRFYGMKQKIGILALSTLLAYAMLSPLTLV